MLFYTNITFNDYYFVQLISMLNILHRRFIETNTLHSFIRDKNQIADWNYKFFFYSFILYLYSNNFLWCFVWSYLILNVSSRTFHELYINLIVSVNLQLKARNNKQIVGWSHSNNERLRYGCLIRNVMNEIFIS